MAINTSSIFCVHTFAEIFDWLLVSQVVEEVFVAGERDEANASDLLDFGLSSQPTKFICVRISRLSAVSMLSTSSETFPGFRT